MNEKTAAEDLPSSQKLTEMELALSRYERTASFLPVYIYAARIENGIIVPEFYSPVVEKITGYPKEEFLRDAWFWLTLVFSEDRAIVNNALRDNFHHEHEATEYRIVRKDGEIRWVRDQLRVTFDDHQQPNGYYGLVEDITERKLIEIELANTQAKLVKNEREVAMAQLANTLMHEINNPLSVILGYAEMLLQLQDVPAPLVKPLQMINQMSLRISDIVKELNNIEDQIIEFGGTKIVNLHRRSQEIYKVEKEE